MRANIPGREPDEIEREVARSSDTEGTATEAWLDAAEEFRGSEVRTRSSLEHKRNEAEEMRNTAEAGRADAEELRAAAEELRQSTEEMRLAAQELCVTSELLQLDSQKQLLAAQAVREANEKQRETLSEIASSIARYREQRPGTEYCVARPIYRYGRIRPYFSDAGLMQ